ncbi:hypothetical protein QQ91_0000380 [Lyngbya confervoides BDU141951]|uniref:General secretion pathway GspH domain-containing protein n=2 Tax=Lyngbya TaxID=28073 RepID=A0ABD4SXB6_9CYAN|nr:hypothetical protein [Lyngbya confervoides]MCM1981291.1 hypothetical protein [Lyngbya confervoides BDU141951]
MPQMIVTLAVIGILSAIAVPSFSIGANALVDTTERVKNQIKLARVKALSTTTAFRLKPVSARRIEIQQHQLTAGTSLSGCQDAAIEIDSNGKSVWKTVTGFSAEDFQFEDGVELTDVSVNSTSVPVTTWQLCFDSRGMADKSIVLELTDTQSGRQRSLEVFMGGAIETN